MTFKQSLKSPEKGDRLHRYIIKIVLVHQQIDFPPNLPTIVIASTLFTTENSI